MSEETGGAWVGGIMFGVALGLLLCLGAMHVTAPASNGTAVVVDGDTDVQRDGIHVQGTETGATITNTRDATKRVTVDNGRGLFSHTLQPGESVSFSEVRLVAWTH